MANYLNTVTLKNYIYFIFLNKQFDKTIIPVSNIIYIKVFEIVPVQVTTTKLQRC